VDIELSRITMTASSSFAHIRNSRIIGMFRAKPWPILSANLTILHFYASASF
tara:strand:- start:322 stop:477 length:156 start_codon:yes stop_codon:yes gene_type:complete